MPDPSKRRTVPLAPYQRKRNFAVTPEPTGVAAKRTGKRTKPLTFVVQKHWASRLHYDFRLELDGVLLSWAVPKGPSYDPRKMQMAIHVEDHPLEYAHFEGTIPPRQYGAGTVITWDRGTWEPVGDASDGMRKGKLLFRLHGEKLAG
ncbi:MAG: DNA polymerase ligase N-terminal domain-containing protein, partial [Burkholderiales bacterium]